MFDLLLNFFKITKGKLLTQAFPHALKQQQISFCFLRCAEQLHFWYRVSCLAPVLLISVKMACPVQPFYVTFASKSHNLLLLAKTGTLLYGNTNEREKQMRQDQALVV